MKKKKSEKESIHQFSFQERVKIETYLEEKKTKRAIARLLNREPSSIRYEIKHNSTRKRYTAQKAQVKSYQRRWRAKWQTLKVAMDSVLKSYVDHAIQSYWSPEAIAGRIMMVDRHVPRVGKDAIYAYLDSPHGRSLEKFLWLRGGTRRNTHPRVTIDGRTMIDKRPKSVARRLSFGHWEGDFIVSGKTGSGALLVLIERKSRYCVIRKLKDRKVATVNAVLSDVFGAQLVIDSLTIDNDISFQKHQEMSALIGAPVYFCHPYHSWEKGAVEKINQLIRKFVPKRSDISKVSVTEIKRIERILNNRPLRCLRFRTPAEVVTRSPRLTHFIENSAWSKYYQFTKSGWVK